MKRIFLFLATNLAIILVASVTLSLLGVDSVLAANGVDLDLRSLLIFAAVFGFGGSFVSLAMSKWIAKRSTGAQVIEQPSNQVEQWLLETVRRQAQQAGIGMPEVAIFPSPDPNAFATGMSKNKALVAVSTGLLNHMDKGEVEAVLGHEIAHVANGDMVTLALIQGVVNTFVIFLARVIGHTVDRVVFKNEQGHGIA
ncbi:MAG TPA: protease HtpX, partial [Candidatus Tenderia sp.]|nr:protease HtpX [Candidatus Tenderia sp.]